MLKRQNRLSSNFEFNITRKYGQTYNAGLFHIMYLKPKNYIGPAKVGFVISNSFDKSAVRRNRLKRLFREAIRNNFAKITQGYWVVIHPRYSAKNKTYEEISSELAQILQKIFVAG